MSSDERAAVGKVQKQLRILQAYAVLSALGFAAILLMALKPTDQKAKFKELEVGRINVVEPDGKLRLTISNNAQSPGLAMGGKYFSAREGTRGAGLIFYNDEGNENGGLAYSGKSVDGKPDADALLAFDQYGQDQIVGLTYRQHDTKKVAGLQVWERPDTPLIELAEKLDEIEKMKDGPEKSAAMKKIREEAVAKGEVGATRLFAGRSDKDDATVMLNDVKGKPRIVMSVEPDGTATLKFMDADGKVIETLPHPNGGGGKP
jgi:hypothetical protein